MRPAKAQRTFKLPADLSNEVDGFCKRTGISQTQFFTEATIEKLGGTGSDNAIQEVRQTQIELTEMRMEMATLARTLLRVTTTDYTLTDDDIKQWLSTNLKHSSHALDF